jgi:hypothetical protein
VAATTLLESCGKTAKLKRSITETNKRLPKAYQTKTNSGVSTIELSQERDERGETSEREKE